MILLSFATIYLFTRCLFGGKFDSFLNAIPDLLIDVPPVLESACQYRLRDTGAVRLVKLSERTREDRR
jgi:hypothetical protein